MQIPSDQGHNTDSELGQFQALALSPDSLKKKRFIELRAHGRSYADIAELPAASKPTLIAWGTELQREVAHARALRIDELCEKYAVATAKRVKVFGKRVEVVPTERDCA